MTTYIFITWKANNFADASKQSKSDGFTLNVTDSRRSSAEFAPLRSRRRPRAKMDIRFGIMLVSMFGTLLVVHIADASDVGWPGAPNSWAGCTSNCMRCLPIYCTKWCGDRFDSGSLFFVLFLDWHSFHFCLKSGNQTHLCCDINSMHSRRSCARSSLCVLFIYSQFLSPPDNSVTDHELL